MKEYMAWDAEFYDSKSRFFPHDHEVHGPFLAKDEDELKTKMRQAGLDPQKVRWELRQRP